MAYEHVIMMRRPGRDRWLVTHWESITQLVAMMTRCGPPGRVPGRFLEADPLL